MIRFSYDIDYATQDYILTASKLKLSIALNVKLYTVRFTLIRGHDVEVTETLSRVTNN